MIKALWVILGLFFVGCAYIGIILPGIPTTFFVILAAWAFSKSSEKFNKWIHEHKLFGKYLTNWETKRIYPYRGRYAMVGVMCLSLLSMYFALPIRVVLYAGITFVLIIFWAFRYPGSVKEYDARIKKGQKIGWFK
jgi:uncharacterized membrane protein YbaN (DUF454 family)|tara:strand:+ start:1401 stop:1808 length:408 start_codon:yes stop_codon:yes gene_type:complete